MTSGQLSGGEVRIAEMYMVLNSEAEFCILDEPFSNVAPKYVEMMQQLIQQHKATKGIIISDHMYESVMDITDDVLIPRYITKTEFISELRLCSLRGSNPGPQH